MEVFKRRCNFGTNYLNRCYETVSYTHLMCIRDRYMEHQVPVDKESFREAYVFGERALAKYPFVQPLSLIHI